MSFLFVALLGWIVPVSAGAFVTPVPAAAAESQVATLYRAIGLAGQLDTAAFYAGYRSLEQHGVHGGVIAIADMTQPSTAKRLFVIDLNAKTLLLRTYVAHGQNTGDLTATHFSNRLDSHQSSLGLFRVGEAITSAKHGRALLLEGLDKSVNDLARARELIIHAADYVSDAFIAAHNRLGRSWGCPAVSRDAMPQLIHSLAGGGLLYVYGG